MVACLEDLPAVDRDSASSELRAGGRLLWALGVMPRVDAERIDHDAARPDGSRLDPFMPWPLYNALDDAEVAALRAWVQGLPARESGGR